MMKTRHTSLGILLAVALLASGCAAHRTESNIAMDAPAASKGITKVLIAENNLPGRKYKEIGPIEISVKKLTVFHADPTREQANEALIESAKKIGADAVINVTYESGIGLTTWGYMDAKGMGVKLLD